MKSSVKQFDSWSRKRRGFSLIELLMVVSIGIVASGMAFISLIPALKDAKVGSSVNTALATLRRAREEAVSKRRVYVVKFITPGTIQVTQNTTTGTPLLTTVLPEDIAFVADSSLPAPGPDNFGTGKVAIDFDQGVSGGQPAEIYFQPDGSAVDIHNNVNNGVVYFGRAGELMSSRAVSLWGATGRLRAWRLDTNSQNNLYWRQQ